jgi:hypothetical protein
MALVLGCGSGGFLLVTLCTHEIPLHPIWSLLTELFGWCLALCIFVNSDNCPG